MMKKILITFQVLLLFFSACSQGQLKPCVEDELLFGSHFECPCNQSCTPTVYFIIGESEAAGRALQTNATFPPSPNSYIWQDRSNTANDEFEILTYSNNMGTSNPSLTFFGAEMEFSRLHEESLVCETCPIYLVKYGRGGTRLCDYWLNGGAGETLVNTNIPLALADLELIEPNIQIGSVFWSQGLNDSGDVNCANDYYDNAVQFISNIRTAIGANAKIIQVRNHDSITNVSNSIVQTAQDQIEVDVPNVVNIDGNNYPLKSDNIHRNFTGNILIARDWWDIR